MITSRLLTIGSTHQARFGESFDDVLQLALSNAQHPGRARRDLDEQALLGILAVYAAAGTYDPTGPPPPSSELQIDSGNQRLRHHPYPTLYSPTEVDVFVFSGVAIDPDHTVVGSVTVRSG